MPIASRIIPLLVYADIAAAHEFLIAAFGFASGGLSRDAKGGNHGEVRVGNDTIWLHRVTEAHAMATAEDAPSSGGLVVYVDDVDAH